MRVLTYASTQPDCTEEEWCDTWDRIARDVADMDPATYAATVASMWGDICYGDRWLL